MQTIYFTELATWSLAYLDSLPIERRPMPLAYALEKLAPELELRRSGAVAELRSLARPQPAGAKDGRAAGLNTVGMLADRFTILLIREWCLRNKENADAAKAEALHQTQTMEIMQALAEAVPGHSSMNSKITKLEQKASAADWEEAFLGLLCTNLVLWESQEILYLKNIAELPAEELRDYISWFSRGNILRNEYIQLCEQKYWEGMADR